SRGPAAAVRRRPPAPQPMPGSAPRCSVATTAVGLDILTNRLSRSRPPRSRPHPHRFGANADGDYRPTDRRPPPVRTGPSRRRRLASWWDRFATVEVQEVGHVHGQEALTSAAHVADTMARWHERGEATGDLGFWRSQLEGFRSPKAFILVLDALLEKKDYRASM